MDVGTYMFDLVGCFDIFNDLKIEGLLIGGPLNSTDGKVLGFDEGIKLEPHDGKVLGTILGDVYGITLGIDVGSELGSLYGYFDGSNVASMGAYCLYSHLYLLVVNYWL